MKFKRTELRSQVNFSQVVLGNFICIPVRLMSENPAMYFKRLRMTRQIVVFTGPLFHRCLQFAFLNFLFYVLDTEHCLGQTEH